MLRRSLLQVLSFIPFLGIKPETQKVIAQSQPMELKGEILTTTDSPIANMTLGEFSDAKTVRMEPEELKKWDEFFKTKPIINKGMERAKWIKDKYGNDVFKAPISREELKEEFDEIAKTYIHRIKNIKEEND